jgi:hypothetical protein
VIEFINKLQNHKINGNHAVILIKLLREEDIEEYIFTYKINLTEIQYLIRKGLIEIEKANTTFDFKTCRLTELGVATAEMLIDEHKEEVVEEVVVSKVDPISDMKWVDEWRELFSSKKVGAGGSKQEVYKKMQIFIKENPDITKEEIFKATELYFNSLDNIKYMQQADYFIFKGKGKEASSRLSQWIEVVKETGGKAEDWYEQI